MFRFLVGFTALGLAIVSAFTAADPDTGAGPELALLISVLVFAWAIWPALRPSFWIARDDETNERLARIDEELSAREREHRNR